MKLCNYCSNPFEITKDRTIFCSHTCQAKVAIQKAFEKRKPRSKTGKNFICIVCNQSFYVSGWRMKRGDAKYCSRSCLGKEHFPKFLKIHGFKKSNKPPHKYKTIKVNGKYIREHRWLMQQHIGRKLEKWEHVHHINGDSSDNRLENLVLLTNSEHQKIEVINRLNPISS